MEFEKDDKFEAWFAEFMNECNQRGYKYPIQTSSVKHYFDTDIPASQAAAQFIGARTR